MENRKQVENKNLKNQKPVNYYVEHIDKIADTKATLSEYTPQLTNETLNKLPTLNKKRSLNYTLDPVDESDYFSIGEEKIVLSKLDKLSINSHKTLFKILQEFTKKNNKGDLKRNNGVDYRVFINIEEYAEERGVFEGIDPNDKNKRKERLKDFKNSLKKEGEVLTDRLIFDNGSDYINITIISTLLFREKSKILYVNLNSDYADALLNKSLLTMFPISLYKIDGRDRNTYSLGVALNAHFTKYSNQTLSKRRTFDRLSIEVLLSYLPEISTYDEVLKMSASWNNEIKNKLENSLDKLKKIGYLKEWHYGKSNNEFLEDEEMTEHLTDYYKWSKLRLYFTPCNYEMLIKNEKVLKEKQKEVARIDSKYTD